MFTNNILIKYFKMFTNFKEITFTDNETSTGKYLVFVPCIIGNHENDIVLSIKMKIGSDTKPLEDFIEFLKTKTNVVMYDEIYQYKISFKNIQILTADNVERNVQLYTLNLTAYAKKEEKKEERR